MGIILGMLFIFPPWLFIEREVLVFKQSSSLCSRVPRGVVCLGMLDRLCLGILASVSQDGTLILEEVYILH